jgi:hypothetical protein
MQAMKFFYMKFSFNIILANLSFVSDSIPKSLESLNEILDFIGAFLTNWILGSLNHCSHTCCDIIATQSLLYGKKYWMRNT